jgi:hypothetical protein
MSRHLWRCRAMGSISIAAALFGMPALSQSGQAGEFTCASGDVACLIKAIREANANGEANTITLEAGTYPLTMVDNNTDGSNGLPSITSPLSLQGAGADVTVIERAAGTPAFRLMHVAATGTLMLEGLTLRGGFASSGPRFEPGGGLFNNGGVVVLTRTNLTGNAAGGGGGLANQGGTVLLTQALVVRNEALSRTRGGGLLNTGTLTLTETTLANNRAETGGGLAASGTELVTNTTVADNEAAVGAGIFQSDGTLTIVTTTFARNHAVVEGGGLFGRMVTLTNVTLTDNFGGRGGGLAGSAVLLNTLLARNTSMDLPSLGFRSPDCVGHIISLGANLLGDPTGCTITLRAADRTGDLGAGGFTSDGTAGRGHVPLLQDSPAVDAGNPAFCPPTDQLGQRRVGVCDIGAVEFRPPTPPHQAVAIDIRPRTFRRKPPPQAVAIDIQPPTFPIPPPRPPSRFPNSDRLLKIVTDEQNVRDKELQQGTLKDDRLLKILKGEPFPPTLSHALEPLPPKHSPDKGCLLKTLKGEPC